MTDVLGDLPRLVREAAEAKRDADAASKAAAHRGSMLPEEAAAIGRFARAHYAMRAEVEKLIDRLSDLP